MLLHLVFWTQHVLGTGTSPPSHLRKETVEISWILCSVRNITWKIESKTWTILHANGTLHIIYLATLMNNIFSTKYSQDAASGDWMASKPTFQGTSPSSSSGNWLSVSSLRTKTVKFPEDEDIDGPRNIGLLTLQPAGMAASPLIFYGTYFPNWNLYNDMDPNFTFLNHALLLLHRYGFSYWC